VKVFYIPFLFLLSGRLPVEMSVHAPIRPPGGGIMDAPPGALNRADDHARSGSARAQDQQF